MGIINTYLQISLWMVHSTCDTVTGHLICTTFITHHFALSHTSIFHFPYCQLLFGCFFAWTTKTRHKMHNNKYDTVTSGTKFMLFCLNFNPVFLSWITFSPITSSWVIVYFNSHCMFSSTKWHNQSLVQNELTCNNQGIILIFLQRQYFFFDFK